MVYKYEGNAKVSSKKDKELFINFIKENIQDGKKICIWGVGQNGRILIDFFINNDLALDKVLDMDENKEGTYVGGCKVKHPDCLFRESNMKYLVFVSSVLAIDSANVLIQKAVNEITIINVQEILSM